MKIPLYIKKNADGICLWDCPFRDWENSKCKLFKEPIEPSGEFDFTHCDSCRDSLKVEDYEN